MKVFLKKIVFFIFPLLAVVIGLSILSKIIIRNKQVYKLESTIHSIILGHSQPECAFNDELIANTKNLAQGGEAYFYTYQKVKKLLPENPQIKTVYISFANNQIEKRMDKWTYDDEHLGNFFPKYSAQINFDDYSLLLKYNYKSVLLSELKALKTNVVFLTKNQNNFLEGDKWGGYNYLKRNKLDSILKHNVIEKVKKEYSDSISTINVNYLEKIVQFCKGRKVEIIFIRTPVHKVLYSIFDESKFQNIRIKKFPNVPFLDFHDYQLTNDEMGDFDHLNYKGAKRFSIYFNDYIKTR